jgi:DNA invertase Pin-like site-specific DNA recombinase
MKTAIRSTTPQSIPTLGYASVSSDEPLDGPEMETQRLAIEGACDRLNLRLVDIVRDQQEDGPNEEQPGLIRALERIESGEASCLIVSHLERLTGRTALLEIVLDRLDGGEARLVALDVGLDSATETGQLAMAPGAAPAAPVVEPEPEEAPEADTALISEPEPAAPEPAAPEPVVPEPEPPAPEPEPAMPEPEPAAAEPEPAAAEPEPAAAEPEPEPPAPEVEAAPVVEPPPPAVEAPAPAAPAPEPAREPALAAAEPAPPAPPPPAPAAAEPAVAVRALGYATVPADADEGTRELDEQRIAIESYCKLLEIDVVEVVREREPKDGKALDRAGLSFLIERIAAGDASCLVVTGLQRLSRSVAELGTIVQWLERNDVRLVAVELDLDTASPGGRTTARALASVAGMESERLSQRTRKGLAAARAKRHASGGTGPDWDEIRKRIANMRADGMTLQAIADTLNEEGVPTQRGGAKWRPSSVQTAAGYKRRSGSKKVGDLPSVKRPGGKGRKPRPPKPS